MALRAILAAALLLFSVFAQSADESRARGIALFKARDYAQAQKLLDALQMQNPGDSEIHFYLGRIALLQGRAEEAVGELRFAASKPNSPAEYYRYFGDALGVHIPDANVFMQLALTRELHEAFRMATVLDPNDLDAREALMLFHLNAPAFAGGNLDKAREQAAEIARRNPARGHRADGDIAFKLGKISDGIREYQAAIAAAPDDVSIREDFAEHYRQLQRYDEAFVLYEDAIRRNPRSSAYHCGLGVTAAVSGQRADRGIEALRACLALGVQQDNDLRPAEIHWRLGMLHQRMNRLDLAKDEYEAALKLEPELKDAKKSLRQLR